jgi:hypothetical protein
VCQIPGVQQRCVVVRSAAPGPPLDQLARASRQGPAIRVHRTVNEERACARHGLDHGTVGVRTARVAIEGHARAIRQFHSLDEYRHTALVRVERQLASIEQRSIRPQRGPDRPHRIEDGAVAMHPDDGLVEPGKGPLLRVLPGCRRANSHSAIADVVRQGLADLHGDGLRDTSLQEGGSDSQRGVPQFLPPHGIQGLATQLHRHVPAQASFGDELLVRQGCDAEASGNPESRLDERTEAGCFAANQPISRKSGLSQGNYAGRVGTHCRTS